MASIENDEWQPILDIETEKNKAKDAAQNTLKKTDASKNKSGLRSL